MVKRTVVVAVCLFFGCSMYFERVSAGAISAENGAFMQDSGADIYTASCAACHGADGRAKTGKGKRAGATDFTGEWSSDEDRCLKLIAKGKGEMPAFKNKLTPAQIRSVFEYVLNFRR